MLRILTATLLIVIAFAANAESFRTYSNERFGATAQVPANWKADPPPENDDGLLFRSPDGRASITVSGGLNIADNVSDAVKTQSETDSDEHVTYRQLGERSMVVSGTRGDRIFYRKSILVCRDQIWNSVAIDYPARDKKAFDALVTRVAHSLRFSGRSAQIDDCR